MDKTTLGAIVLIVGIAILIESLFADGIGIGFSPRFGSNQLIGTILGGILTASGLFLLSKSKSKSKSESE
ncbi:MAG: hypothetical protein DRR15_17710 [Gammaproteobacteria bacterium]|nr:MAG: hypothetical protein DRR15_17710 [Gammaproteobacteria bacterium]